MDKPTVEWIPTDEPDRSSTNALVLWTPRGIGWASVFLGFPGAIVLAALNWRRIGRTRKAMLHLAAAFIGTWLVVVVNVNVALISGLAVGYYLNRVQRNDQSAFVAAGWVTERNGLAGAVIAIVATLAIAISAILPISLIENAVGGREVANRGQVLFFKDGAPKDCSSAGQETVFTPTDPIAWTAIMRETVQVGSHVVGQVEASGQTIGTAPVTVQPPYYCLSLTKSVGPLDIGTYVVRYRYEGQPEAPDLATGTFTVSASPRGSPSPVVR